MRCRTSVNQASGSISFSLADWIRVATIAQCCPALRALDSLIASGTIQIEDEVPHVRAIGQTMSRLADWQVRELMTRIAGAAGDAERARAAAAEMTGTLLPVVERLMSYAWRRHLVAAAGRILGSSADQLSTATVVVGFADIVGYTSTVRHSDVNELARLLESFEKDAADTVVSNHGRVVKSLGDEVLFVADTPRDAAEIAVRLSDPARPSRGLPELRVGMALGQVLTRFGDVYGPTVNLASRLTSLARPGPCWWTGNSRRCCASRTPTGCTPGVRPRYAATTTCAPGHCARRTR